MPWVINGLTGKEIEIADNIARVVWCMTSTSGRIRLLNMVNFDVSLAVSDARPSLFAGREQDGLILTGMLAMMGIEFSEMDLNFHDNMRKTVMEECSEKEWDSMLAHIKKKLVGRVYLAIYYPEVFVDSKRSKGSTGGSS